jgi:hypothetical protein
MNAKPDRLIDSTPALIPSSSSPVAIPCASWIVVVSEEAQNRLTVYAGT